MPISVLDLLKYRLSPFGSSQELEALNNALPQIRQRQPDMPRSYGEAEMIPVPNTGYQTSGHPLFAQEHAARMMPQREERLTNELHIGRMLRDQGSGAMAEGAWQSMMPMPQSMFPSPLNQLMRNPWALY